MGTGSSDSLTELDHGRYVHDEAYRSAVHREPMNTRRPGRSSLSPTWPIYDHDRPSELHISHDPDRACCQAQPWRLTIHEVEAVLRGRSAIPKGLESPASGR